mmetsp:Transcript_162231/g.311505  ORF Transcript_162231/g.311505 Transcript_162231/m.311505 type:complete len:212 (-) Transcript_162231:76-711(-)
MFASKADFSIRFMPFQLYPNLPGSTSMGIINTGGNSEGVAKREFFRELGKERGRTPEQGKEMFTRLQDAWAKEGLTLSSVTEDAKWGSSFDAQRLILFARKQGRENAMIEAVYTANHVKGQCLSDFKVLLDAAEKAGVTGAEEMLKSSQLVDEVQNQIMHFHRIGVNSVPILLINEKYPIHGAPEQEVLNQTFATLIQHGELPVPPKRLLS